jgi:RHS repeat-associated protein
VAQLLVSGNALNRRFDYDPIYRLLSATGRECDRLPEGPPWQDQPRCTDLTKARAYTERYTYDPMGNMLRLEHQHDPGGFTREFTLETANNRPVNNRLRRMQIGADGYDYTFDTNGNMRSETLSRHLEWNHSDQMKVFRTQTDGAEPSVYAHYLYDAGGQRVKKLVRKQGGQVEVTHYLDGAFEHHRWGGQAQAGENNHVHVMDDTQRIAIVRLGPAHPDDRGPAAQFHLGDHLGSSNVVVDSGGALVNREEFTPYGETSFGSFAKKRYRFAGEERDEESGFAYHSARYYSAPLARWLSCDPRPQQDGATLYSYVSNRPVILFDPTGEEEKDNPSGKATVQQEAVHLTDPYENPSDPSWAKETFNAFFFGGKGPKAQHRYNSLGEDQNKIKAIIDNGHGCTACHLSTEIHNKYGRIAFNPENNLPWDWAINMKGYNDWVATSVVARALVEAGTGTALFAAQLRAGSSFVALNNARASDAEFTFYRPQGVHVKPTTSEIDLFRRSVRERKEYSRSFFDSGRSVTHRGDRLSVSLEPGASRTLHTHPTSKVALPSGGDIAAYRRYPPNTVHEILGDKWPTTRSTLAEMKLAPPPLDPIKWRGRTGDIPRGPLNPVTVSRPSSRK